MVYNKTIKIDVLQQIMNILLKEQHRRGSIIKLPSYSALIVSEIYLVEIIYIIMYLRVQMRIVTTTIVKVLKYKIK